MNPQDQQAIQAEYQRQLALQREKDRAEMRAEEEARATTTVANQAPDAPFVEDQEARLQGDIKTFSDRLRDRRTATGIASQRAGDAFSGALDSEVPLRPSQVFNRFQSFQTAAREFVSPLEDQLFKREQLLADIKGQKRQEYLDVLLAGMKEGQTGLGLGLEFEGEMTPSNILSLAGENIESNSNAKRYRELLREIAELRDLQQAFQKSSPSGNKIINMLDPTTGTLGKLMGTGLGSTDDRELRSRLQKYFSGERHRLYGSVLTEGETKEALRTLPHTGAQEIENIFRIDAALEDKQNEIVGLFQDEGFPENDIGYIVTSAGLTDEDQAIMGGEAVAGAQVGTRLDPYIQEAEADFSDY